MCLLGLVACNVEHYDDCDDEDGFDFEDDFGGSHSSRRHIGQGRQRSERRGRRQQRQRRHAAERGRRQRGGTTATPEPEPEPATPCEKERDCDPGFNCNLDVNECQPADEETCGELETEAACTDRSDCTPIYGGTQLQLRRRLRMPRRRARLRLRNLRVLRLPPRRVAAPRQPVGLRVCALPEASWLSCLTSQEDGSTGGPQRGFWVRAARRWRQLRSRRATGCVSNDARPRRTPDSRLL